MEPSWVEHALWWHVYPLGFLGAEESALPPDAPVTHRLPGLVPWLDYLVELGASGLLLGPVFASETHGYDTVDHLRVDPRLGDEADLQALFEAAHARGVRVLLDGVFNHVGRGFPRFEQALREGPGSESASWFHLFWQGAGEPEYEHFEGHRSLVTLDHGSAAVADYVTDVMTTWLDRGADGWRLDAAYAVPLAFWAQVLPRVRARHPDAYVVGEVIHGDYAAFVDDGAMDAVTQYELWKAIWSSLNDRNLFELSWALQRHAEFLTSFVPMTFLGNHDVTRIASRVDDERHLAHALVVLCTVPGTPSVYAGDEQGYRGVKEDREGGDAEVRPPFPPTPEELSTLGHSTYALHRRLIGLRRRHPWLHRAELAVASTSNDGLVYGVAAGSDDRLVVVLNVGDDVYEAPVPGLADPVLLDGAADLGTDETGVSASVPPHSWAILAPR